MFLYNNKPWLKKNKKIIDYSIYYNNYRCIPEIMNKNLNTNKTNLSYNHYISQVIKQQHGRKIQFGNFYLGEKMNINYLGRTEGQSGGSGAPLRNKY